MPGSYPDNPSEAEKSAAMAHVDQAEILARKVPGLDPSIEPMEISRAVVLGAGVTSRAYE